MQSIIVGKRIRESKKLLAIKSRITFESERLALESEWTIIWEIFIWTTNYNPSVNAHYPITIMVTNGSTSSYFVLGNWFNIFRQVLYFMWK